ncbi:MAG TPA: HAMP domain-containing sensor histidine kinase [Dermatophilaceae bacterium]|nr:HAMP domain-containing sensor histidine kinase [Dermatophilaceae bacterium]
MTPISAWTLRTKLVVSVVVLFLGVTITTGGLTILALRGSLTDQLDRDLAAAAHRFHEATRPDGQRDDTPGPGSLAEEPFGPPGGRGSELHLLLHQGSVVKTSAGEPVNSLVNKDGAYDVLTTQQITALNAAQLGPAPKSVNLGGDAGSYRLVATTDSGLTLITGVSTSGVDAAVSKLTTFVGLGILIGLGVVGAGGTYLVRRNLAPLQRVAATATRVSHLPLDSGAVDMADRVPEVDTDPRTEVGQVGAALNEMLDHVHSALNARHESEMRVRQFVADASHELRTPLASIRGYAELSRREQESVPTSVTHALGRVESEAVRMSGLVEDMLLLARLDAGRPLERGPVDLTHLAVDAVGDAHAASPDHVWELELPDEPVEVPGDRARLHQVVANLLANARTHTPPGTKVVTTISLDGTWVKFSVRDNGPGIPESLQDKVFQRFTRGDDSRSRVAGSTGLGLSIVAAVAEAHGGKVELDSAPGDTTFSVLLPAA